MSPLNLITIFRYVAIFEGISYLSLAGTMPLKYMADMPMPNYIVGMAHGILFIMYVGLLILCWNKYHWTFSRVFLLFIASLVPFGTFIADAKILKPVERGSVS